MLVTVALELVVCNGIQRSIHDFKGVNSCVCKEQINLEELMKHNVASSLNHNSHDLKISLFLFHERLTA
jgi:hypothetical protein